MSIADIFRAQKWELTPEWEVLPWKHTASSAQASDILTYGKHASCVQDLAPDSLLQQQP